MIIMMYHSKMLSFEEINKIPRTTRNNWNRFAHADYFGYEIAQDYITDFDYIKDVLTKKHLNRAMKFACSLSYGYSDLIGKIEQNKKLLREHAGNITFSIKRITRLGKIKVTDACKIFGVTKDWYYTHRNPRTCSLNLFGKCFKQYPNQLTSKEVKTIENIIKAPENQGKPKTTLYYRAINQKVIICGRSTFSKYANFFGYKRIRKVKHKGDEKPKPFRASRPFEWLHVDVTFIQTQQDGIQKVAFVKDNFSKALLHYKSISDKVNGNFIKELFEETFKKYKLYDASKPINILSDGGPENKGVFLEWVNQITAPPLVTKITANTPGFPYSNNMSESTHSIYKTEFMKSKFSLNINQHFIDLDQFMLYYNYERYPCEHYGVIPMDVLNGEIPNKAKYKEPINEARIKRIEKNKEFNQCLLQCI